MQESDIEETVLAVIRTYACLAVSLGGLETVRTEKRRMTKKLLQEEPSSEDEMLKKFASYAQVDLLTSTMTSGLLKMVWVHPDNIL